MQAERCDSRHAPDYSVEQFIISKQRFLMKQRAPGKYDALTTFLHISSNLFPHAEVAYHTGRGIDDVVDGDAPLPVGFHSIHEWLTYLEEQTRSGGVHIQKAPTIEFLLKRTIERFEHSRITGIDIRHELLRFLASMKIECTRREECRALPQKELWELYLEEFGAPHSIMLAAFGSKTRDHDIPELSLFLGRSYNQKDLLGDLPRGIINIPQEILNEAELSTSDCVNQPHEVIQHPIVVKWRQQEVEDCFLLRQTLSQKRFDTMGKIYVRALFKI